MKTFQSRLLAGQENLLVFVDNTAWPLRLASAKDGWLS